MLPVIMCTIWSGSIYSLQSVLLALRIINLTSCITRTVCTSTVVIQHGAQLFTTPALVETAQKNAAHDSSDTRFRPIEESAYDKLFSKLSGQPLERIRVQIAQGQCSSDRFHVSFCSIERRKRHRSAHTQTTQPQHGDSKHRMSRDYVIQLAG